MAAPNSRLQAELNAVRLDENYKQQRPVDLKVSGPR